MTWMIRSTQWPVIRWIALPGLLLTAICLALLPLREKGEWTCTLEWQARPVDTVYTPLLTTVASGGEQVDSGQVVGYLLPSVQVDRLRGLTRLDTTRPLDPRTRGSLLQWFSDLENGPARDWIQQHVVAEVKARQPQKDSDILQTFVALRGELQAVEDSLARMRKSVLDTRDTGRKIDPIPGIAELEQRQMRFRQKIATLMSRSDRTSRSVPGSESDARSGSTADLVDIALQELGSHAVYAAGTGPLEWIYSEGSKVVGYQIFGSAPGAVLVGLSGARTSLTPGQKFVFRPDQSSSMTSWEGVLLQPVHPGDDSRWLIRFTTGNPDDIQGQTLNGQVTLGDQPASLTLADVLLSRAL